VNIDDLVVSGAENFRDTGGLPAAGGVSRHGVLYRSGHLAALDDAGRRALGDLGVRRIIDLRSDEEVSHSPSRVDGLSVEVQRVPLYLGSVQSLFEEDLSLAEMYRRLVEDSAGGVVAVVRGILAEQPVVVHCTVGKDRTGVTVALTLAAAGVEHEAIVADYARTEGLLPQDRNRQIAQWLRAAHPDAVNIVDLATRSPDHVMRDLLGDVAQRYGSVGEYLRAHGVADDELVELRRVLIDET
jgi:protein-tyrosine phosphatase